MEDKDILEEDYEQYEDHTDEEVEETETKAEPQEKDFMTIVKETVKGVIEDYAGMARMAKDDYFLIGYENPKKNIDECINYVMNNLTKQRIYGGRDSLMYPFIHDYYVDEIKPELLKDNWSMYLRNPSGNAKPKAELTEEQKAKLMKKAEEEFILEEKRRLQEEEKKRLEKEKARLQKQKEREKEKEIQKAIEEQKAKEEAKKNGAAEQMSLFDIL